MPRRRWNVDLYTKIRRARAGGYHRGPRPERFQGDTRWHRDFRRLLELEAERAEHVYACKQLHEVGAHEEAKAELALADEDSEQIDLLVYCLTHLDGGPDQGCS